MLAMWGVALAIVIVQRDLGAALLYFLVFLALVYVATRRSSYVVLGLLLFLVGGALLYVLFTHVQDRINIWIDPFIDPQGAGYQIIRGDVRVRAGRHPRHGSRRGLAPGGQHAIHSGLSIRTSCSQRWPRSWACSARSLSSACTC